MAAKSMLTLLVFYLCQEQGKINEYKSCNYLVTNRDNSKLSLLYFQEHTQLSIHYCAVLSEFLPVVENSTYRHKLIKVLIIKNIITYNDLKTSAW